MKWLFCCVWVGNFVHNTLVLVLIAGFDDAIDIGIDVDVHTFVMTKQGLIVNKGRVVSVKQHCIRRIVGDVNSARLNCVRQCQIFNLAKNFCNVFFSGDKSSPCSAEIYFTKRGRVV